MVTINLKFVFITWNCSLPPLNRSFNSNNDISGDIRNQKINSTSKDDQT